MVKESILVISIANMDVVVTADHFPQPGERIFGKKFAMFPGGKGANPAVACARLDGTTYFIGKMRNDIFEEQLIQNLQDNGIDLEHLFIDSETSTDIALITVTAKGENEVVVVSGSNMKLTSEEIESKQPLFQRAKLVLTQLEFPWARSKNSLN